MMKVNMGHGLLKVREDPLFSSGSNTNTESRLSKPRGDSAYPHIVSNVSVEGMLSKEDPDSLTCPICGKCMKQRVHLRDHMRTHTGEKPYQCPHCDHKATQKSNLKKHIEKIHKQ